MFPTPPSHPNPPCRRCSEDRVQSSSKPYGRSQRSRSTEGRNITCEHPDLTSVPGTHHTETLIRIPKTCSPCDHRSGLQGRAWSREIIYLPSEAGFVDVRSLVPRALVQLVHPLLGLEPLFGTAAKIYLPQSYPSGSLYHSISVGLSTRWYLSPSWK